MTTSDDAWATFKRIVAEFDALVASPSAPTSSERLEALLAWLDRLELAYLDLAGDEGPEPRAGFQNTWRSWFAKIQTAFPGLTTYHSVHPTSLEWPEPKLRALPDELALVLASIDYALWLDERGEAREGMHSARAAYEQQMGSRLAHVRSYVFNQRFQPEGNE